MSQIQPARESSKPNPSPLSGELARDWTRNPFWQLPDEWRPVAWEFWAFWSQQLQHGQLALATRVRQWIGEGLTLADLKAAFYRTNEPGAAARPTHGGELLAALAENVANVLRERRRRDSDRRARTTTLGRF